ncbi:unnamed protein product [Ascophyllum nodosum]
MDSVVMDRTPLSQARTNSSSASRHAHSGSEPRAESVQGPNAATQGLMPPQSQPQTLRRRDRSAVNTKASGSEPSRDRVGDAGMRSNGGSTVRNTQSRRQQQRQQQQTTPVDSANSNAPPTKKLSSRSPVVRYLILSLVLIALGLAVRYLWRQLAGLAGAWLILSVARRWTSEHQEGEPDATLLISGDTREKVCEEIGKYESSSAAVGEQSTLAAVLGAVEETGVSAQEALEVYVDDAVNRAKMELEWDGAFADAPTELRRYWEDAGPNCRFVVRGANYMSDKKKIPAGPAVMRLVHVDFFAVESGDVFHLASKGRCRDRISAFVKGFEDRGETAPFLFILNIIVPGTPVVGSVMYWALDRKQEVAAEANATEKTRANDVFVKMLERYAEVPGSGYKQLERVKTSPQTPASSTAPRRDAEPASAGGSDSNGISGNAGAENSEKSPKPSGGGGGGDVVEEGSCDSAAGRETVPTGSSEATSATVEGLEGAAVAAEGKRDGDCSVTGLLPLDDFRNQRFKLIPTVVEGPYIVRKAVGNKPALLGRKLNQRYFRGSGYVETDVDVGSSMIAERIVSLCRGYARSLTVELGVCMEGRCAEELPEKCIGVIRLVNVDIGRAEPLYSPEPTSAPPSPSLAGGERKTASEGSIAVVGLELPDSTAVELPVPVIVNAPGQVGNNVTAVLG